MKYYVRCYSAPYESTATDDIDRAYRLAHELGEEHGHTDIIQTDLEFPHIVWSY